jgi:hypothetical protein
LYFKAEKLVVFRKPNGYAKFCGWKITIKYKDTSATDATRVDKSIVLNLVGNTVSLQSDTDSAAYGSAISSASTSTGDARLYLKGGEGSLAVVSFW